MVSFILVVDEDLLLNEFEKHYYDKTCISVLINNTAEYLNSVIYAQINIDFPNLTDHQDWMFEVTYEPLLSDNTMTKKQYSDIYSQYAAYTIAFNKYVNSLINPDSSVTYCEIDNTGDNIYVFCDR